MLSDCDTLPEIYEILTVFYGCLEIEGFGINSYLNTDTSDRTFYKIFTDDYCQPPIRESKQSQCSKLLVGCVK